jgi:hypothetical protein
MARKKIPIHVEADVLIKSKRRCCLCAHLHKDLRVKAGQICHLDSDSSNNELDNLAFLCLEHHHQYDSTSPIAKGFVITEIQQAKASLYQMLSDVRGQHEALDVRVRLAELIREFGRLAGDLSMAAEAPFLKKTIFFCGTRSSS